MPRSPRSGFGKWLAAARAKAKLTQTQAAQSVGITTGHWHKLERGAVLNPESRTVSAIAEVFGVTSGKLLDLLAADRRESEVAS